MINKLNKLQKTLLKILFLFYLANPSLILGININEMLTESFLEIGSDGQKELNEALSQIASWCEKKYTGENPDTDENPEIKYFIKEFNEFCGTEDKNSENNIEKKIKNKLAKIYKTLEDIYLLNSKKYFSLSTEGQLKVSYPLEHTTKSNQQTNIARNECKLRLTDFMYNLSREIDYLNDSNILKNKKKFGVFIKPIFHFNQIVSSALAAEVNFRYENHLFGISTYDVILKKPTGVKFDKSVQIFSAKTKIAINKNIYLRAIYTSCNFLNIDDFNLISGFWGSKMPINENLNLIGEVGYSYLVGDEKETKNNAFYQDRDKNIFGLEGVRGNFGLALNYGQFNAEIKATYSPTTDVKNSIKKFYLSYSGRAGFEQDWWSFSIGVNQTISFAEIMLKF